MKTKKAWLSRQRDGNYMVTYTRPDKHKIVGTEVFDFYVPYGDAIGLRYWCPGGVKAFFGVDIPIGEQVQVWINAGKVEDA